MIGYGVMNDVDGVVVISVIMVSLKRFRVIVLNNFIGLLDVFHESLSAFFSFALFGQINVSDGVDKFIKVV